MLNSSKKKQRHFLFLFICLIVWSRCLRSIGRVQEHASQKKMYIHKYLFIYKIIWNLLVINSKKLLQDSPLICFFSSHTPWFYVCLFVNMYKKKFFTEPILYFLNTIKLDISFETKVDAIGTQEYHMNKNNIIEREKNANKFTIKLYKNSTDLLYVKDNFCETWKYDDKIQTSTTTPNNFNSDQKNWMYFKKICLYWCSIWRSHTMQICILLICWAYLMKHPCAISFLWLTAKKKNCLHILMRTF